MWCISCSRMARAALSKLAFEPPSGKTLFYFFVALIATAPAWIVRHPPLQDVPFHLATLRVIHDYHNPRFGFEELFDIHLFGTQYVLYYLAGSLLAYVLGVYKANIALMCLYLGGVPLALRALLRAMGKDERLSILSLPLVVNVMFILGLMPFLIGLPLAIWALAVAIRYFEEPTRGRGVLLGVLAVALFYTHVLPFGLFGLGVMTLFPWTRPNAWVRSALPFIPAVLLLGWWTFLADAGSTARGALTSQVAAPLDEAIRILPDWTFNVFRDATDEYWFIAFVLVVIVCLGLAQGDADRTKGWTRPYALLVLACVVLYFTMGDTLGPFWLFAKRFPVAFSFLVIPLLRMPQGIRGWIATGCALFVGAGSIINTCRHFIQFELREVGDFEGALEAMDPRKKVCGLIFDKGSNVVHNVPFLHFVSYYQAEKGGLVLFSYAGFLHWPFTFKPGQVPPPGKPPILRWEWMPERVPMNEIFPYYDYVLTRGSGFHPPSGTYHVKWHGDAWTVWARD